MRVWSCIVICVLFVMCAADKRTLFKKTAAEPLTVPEVILKARERKPSAKNDVNLCQRHSLNMTLADKLNVTVITPLQYDAGYCHGECPTSMLAHLNGTNYTLMQSLAPKPMPKPCCVPTEFSLISVLYIDLDMNVAIATLKDMVVKSCGCR